MTPYESDIAFLKEIGASQIDHISWRVDAFPEAAYYIEYHKDIHPKLAPAWHLAAIFHHVSVNLNDDCPDGSFKSVFERLKKIAEFIASI